MDYIYMNNFRGFTQTVIPIRSVNFLVGENSTGKTSFIALLELLSKVEFWYNFDFNAGNYEFGGFKDIVSALSEDQIEFQIGLFKHNKKVSEESVYYMMHFRKTKDGIPQLIRFSQLCQKHLATIKISERQLAAYLSNEPSSCMDFSSPYECFKFMYEVPFQSYSYKNLHFEKEKFMRIPPIVAFPVIMNQLCEDEKIKTANFKHYPFPRLTSFFAGMAPIRTTPKRTYDGYTKRFNPEGEHTPYVIRKRLPKRKKPSNEFKIALENFGRESGLFQTIGVTRFGKDLSAPFELTVTLNTKALRVNSVGYGVSQVLPVVVELITNSKNSWLAIQQPEVHLHPKAQAALGDVIFHAATDELQTLFIETHSDYLLDRFRLNMRDNNHPDGFAQVVFFERSNNDNQVYPMVIDSAGEYPEDQPAGFRAFFLAEHQRILGI